MTDKTYLKQHDIIQAARELSGLIMMDNPSQPVLLYGVPRGGIPAAYVVMAELQRRHIRAEMVGSPEACHYIVDDIVDSGVTRDKFMLANPTKRFVALFFKHDRPNEWLVFPWEDSLVGSATDIPMRLLQFIGEDVSRGGLEETPKRFIKAWQDYTSGYGRDAADVLKTFEDGAEGYDEMVLQKNIPIYSHCEHHLAPFFGVAHIAYIPNGKVVGLSKLSRVVDIYMRRLQVQERLTALIADALNDHLKPKGVAVVLECRHLCMESRGIQQQGTSTTTSALRGVFMEQGPREEFMRLIK